MLPWLHWELSIIYRAHWWPAMVAESTILQTPCHAGPKRNVLVQQLLRCLGNRTEAFVNGLVNTIVCLCSEEAQRLLGLQEPHVDREQENSPVAIPCPPGEELPPPALDLPAALHPQVPQHIPCCSSLGYQPPHCLTRPQGTGVAPTELGHMAATGPSVSAGVLT